MSNLKTKGENQTVCRLSEQAVTVFVRLTHTLMKLVTNVSYRRLSYQRGYQSPNEIYFVILNERVYKERMPLADYQTSRQHTISPNKNKTKSPMLFYGRFMLTMP